MNPEILKVLTEAIASFPGIYLWDAEFNERTRVLRVFIDADSGVDVEVCARVSTAISERLDEIDLIPNSYRLEVSSPGIERILRRPEHFKTVIGKNVKLILNDRVQIGRLVSADEQGVKITGSGGDAFFSYHNIKRAKIFEPELIKGVRI